MQKRWLNHDISLHWVNENSCLLQVETLNGRQAELGQAEFLQAANAWIQAWTTALLSASPDWLDNYVPSYTSLLIVHDLAVSDAFMVTAFMVNIAETFEKQGRFDTINDKTNYEKPSHQQSYRQSYQQNQQLNQNTGRAKHYNIPVCYDPQLGMQGNITQFKSELKSMPKPMPNDIDMVASYISQNNAIENAKQTYQPQDVVKLHTSRQYKVYAVGFLPNFAYMGLSDDALHIPRLSTPRKRVPAGAVAIADNQTAIYPQSSPGGWHILGYTPIALNQHAQLQFEAGDTVSFYEISAEQYISELEHARELEHKRELEQSAENRKPNA